MSDIYNGLNLEYIRSVHSDGVTEVTSKVSSHKSTGDTLWSEVEGEHSTRYSQIDGKEVDVNG